MYTQRPNEQEGHESWLSSQSTLSFELVSSLYGLEVGSIVFFVFSHFCELKPASSSFHLLGPILKEFKSTDAEHLYIYIYIVVL